MTQTYGDLGLNKYRKQITGHKKGMRIRKFLLMNSKKMDYFIKREFEKWLLDYPELREIYYAKETLHNHILKIVLQMPEPRGTTMSVSSSRRGISLC